MRDIVRACTRARSRLWPRMLSLALGSVATMLVACAQPTPAPTPTPRPQPTLALESARTPTNFPPTPKPTLAPTRALAPTATPGPAPTPIPAFASLSVTLKKGLNWSDNSPLTARDIVGTYDILWALGDPVWALLNDVSARDDRTADFGLGAPNVFALHAILRQRQIAPYSQYGWLMQRASDLRKANAGANSPERREFIETLLRYNPSSATVAGPFKVDAKNSVTTALALSKNAAGYNAAQVDFDGITLFSGDAETAGRLYFNRELDYATVPMPSAVLTEFAKLPGMFLPGGRSGFGPGLLFNRAMSPLDKREVRQALAYAIDRDRVRRAAVGEAGATSQFVVGFSDALAPMNLPAESAQRLNPYKKDARKVDELLRGAKFTKDANGQWLDDKGRALQFELSVPEEFTDWVAAANDVAAQLAELGIRANVRAFPSAERDDRLRAGKFDIMLDVAFKSTPPHPAASFGLWLGHAAIATPPDFADELKACGEGFAVATPRPACAALAQFFNDQVPLLPLWENLGSDIVDTQTRATSWLPKDDKIWRQNYVTDNYAAAQLLTGGLKASANNLAKQFSAFQPMPSLDKLSNNPFSPNFFGNQLGPFAGPLVNPPLFFFNWADGKYEPALAESYEAK